MVHYNKNCLDAWSEPCSYEPSFFSLSSLGKQGNAKFKQLIPHHACYLEEEEIGKFTGKRYLIMSRSFLNRIYRIDPMPKISVGKTIPKGLIRECFSWTSIRWDKNKTNFSAVKTINLYPSSKSKKLVLFSSSFKVMSCFFCSKVTYLPSPFILTVVICLADLPADEGFIGYLRIKVLWPTLERISGRSLEHYSVL